MGVQARSIALGRFSVPANPYSQASAAPALHAKASSGAPPHCRERRLICEPNTPWPRTLIVHGSPSDSRSERSVRKRRPRDRLAQSSWGPGKFDAEVFMDGKALRPDNESAATLIPAAFGLAGVNLHTYTGWGSVTYWNAFVANLEMHGKGTFFDPRLDNAAKFPVAAQTKFGHVRITPTSSRRSWQHSTSISSRSNHRRRPPVASAARAERSFSSGIDANRTSSLTSRHAGCTGRRVSERRVSRIGCAAL